MNLNLKGKIAFISGSTSGIGFSTARILLDQGMQVYINGRSEETVNEAIKKLNDSVSDANVFGIVADFRSSSAAKNCIDQLPEIDILINNVGIYKSQSFFETSIDSWIEQFQVNLMSGVQLSQHYLNGMLKRNWGRILFISSECAYLIPQDMISYSSTKAAMHATSRGLSQLTKETGVTVNTVVPGSTLSEGAQRFLADKAKVEEKDLQMIERNFFKTERPSSLLQRFASTDEVGNTIAYICSPLASATNGSVIKVDGGSSGGIF